MARPYGGGDEGRWGARWHERDERRGGGEGWQGEHDRDFGSRERGGWEERGSEGEPRRYGSGGLGERDEGRWYGGAWGREQEGGRERGALREGDRWTGDRTERGGRRWRGGVRGAEAGQPYGSGFFGTAYALYAGRREPGEGERGRMGRGPKGYRRSDERIQDEVCERIARAGVEADDVEVKVENAEVTLSGSVHRREEKRWLEELAEDVFGVQEVHNHLRVARHEQAGTQGQVQQEETFRPRH